MKTIANWGISVGLLLLFLVYSAENQAQDVSWRADLEQAKREAAVSGKLVLLHFGAAWCRPCQQVEAYVFKTPKVIRAINELVIPVRIDVDHHPDLVKKFSVKSIPEDVFITADEQIVQRMKSPTDAENYLKALDSLKSLGAAIMQDKQRMAELDNLTHGVQAAAQQKVDQVTAWRNPKFELPVSINPGASADKFSFEPAAVDSKPSLASDFETQVRRKYGLDAERPSDAAASSSKQSTATAIPAPSSLPTDARVDPSARAGQGLQPRTNQETMNQVSNPKYVATPTANAAPSSVAPADMSLPPTNYALNGDCPVSLLTENRWVAGDPRFGCVHRGRVYLFETEEKQRRFLSSPDEFSPLLAGYDPVAFRDEGTLREGLRELGIVMTQNERQMIVLFASEENARKFKERPTLYLETIRVAIERIDAPTTFR